MDDDTRGALGAAVRSGGSLSTTALGPSRQPLALAALVGVTVAAVPSLGAHLLSDRTIRDAGEHARPLITLVLVAPLAAVMVVAAAGWLGGRGSLRAAVCQLSAIALVAACFFAAVLGMEQPSLLTVGGGFLLIGGAIGLGIAFALGGSADSSGPVLAKAGWVGCALPLVLQMFVAYVVVTISPPAPEPGARLYLDLGSIYATVCGLTVTAALVIGVTVVPLGGRLGEWLRRQGTH